MTEVVAARVAGHLEHLRGRAVAYAEKARADATKKAYRTDWAEFTAWAAHHGLQTIPAEPLTVVYYIVELAAVDHRPPAGVDQQVPPGRFPSPTEDPEVQAVWAGICHEHGTARAVADPISVPLLRTMLAKLPTGARGKRDRAFLLVGFAAALRRSELLALDVADVRQAP